MTTDETISIPLETVRAETKNRLAQFMVDQLSEFNPDDEKGFSKVIDICASDLGISPAQLSKEFLVSEASISRWATGASTPPKGFRLHIAKRLQEMLTHYNFRRLARTS